MDRMNSVIGIFMIGWIAGLSNGIHEYCSYDTFRAECGSDEVVLMSSAEYGRMRVGKCVTRSTSGRGQNIGCSEDVLHIMDGRCTGRQKCELDVANRQFEALDPCFQLKSYLEASYTCARVARVEGGTCTNQPHTLTAPSIYLSSILTDQSNCGSRTAPWIVKSQPGQQIKFTLIDVSGNPDSQPGSGCTNVGSILDIGKTFSICGMNGEREKLLYTSNSHEVQVVIIASSERSNKGSFLLKYEVIGCADLDPPDYSEYSRDGSVARLSCKYTDHSWVLKCAGSHWTGVIGNCSGTASAKSGKTLQATQNEVTIEDLSPAIIIAFIIGVGLVLLSIVIMLTIVCFIKRKPPPPPPTLPADYEYTAPNGPHPLHGPSGPHTSKTMQAKPTLQRRNLPPTPDELSAKRRIQSKEGTIAQVKPLLRRDSQQSASTMRDPQHSASTRLRDTRPRAAVPQLPGAASQLQGAPPLLPGAAPLLPGAAPLLPGAVPLLPRAPPELPKSPTRNTDYDNAQSDTIRTTGTVKSMESDLSSEYQEPAKMIFPKAYLNRDIPSTNTMESTDTMSSDYSNYTNYEMNKGRKYYILDKNAPSDMYDNMPPPAPL